MSDHQDAVPSARPTSGEAIFAELFSELSQILWILKPNGDIDRFNATWTGYTGLPDVMEGLSWAEVFHPDDRTGLVAARTAGIAAGHAYEAEARMRRADGVYRRHLCRVKPLRRGAEIYAWLGSATDVEDWRQAHEERDRAQALDHAGVLLGDVLRESTDPAELTRRATALLGRTLQACRVAYAVVDDERGLAFIEDDWRVSPDFRPSRGQYLISDWGAFLEDLARGDIVAIEDVAVDPRTAGVPSWSEWNIRALAFVPLLQGGRLKAYILVHDQAPRAWRADELSLIRMAADRLWSALESASARHIAREIPETVDALMWSADPEGAASYFNRSWYDFTGLSRGAPLGEGWRTVVHPDDLAHTERLWTRSLAEGVDYRVEHRLRNRAGDYRWMLSQARPIRAAGGGVAHWYGTSIDIHELKENQRHRELLVNELNHRVKNTLALVQGMARQSLRDAPDQSREAFEGRLIALAGAHDILTRHSWEAAFLDELIEQALRPFVRLDDLGRIHIQGPRMRLDSRHAVAFALAIHELATNAAKYGALSVDRGRVEVNWWLSNMGGGPQMKLLWIEQNGPKVRAPIRTGFGSRLIHRGVAQELRGEVRLEYLESGVRCEITAPLPYAAADAVAPASPREKNPVGA